MRFTPPSKRNERGVTILIVGMTLLVLIAMAALAIDVASLYVTRSEAQRAADAAALAGARMFVTSGYTSAPGAWATPSALCASGSATTAAVNQQAAVAARANLIAGQPAVIRNITCNFDSGDAFHKTNPQVTVTIEKTGPPAYFSRIWGVNGGAITATATAEAYNQSGHTSLPVLLTGVRPWLIPNCDPTITSTACPQGSAGYFVDTTNGAVQDNHFIGLQIGLQRSLSDKTGGDLESDGHGGSTPGLSFYGLNYPDTPVCRASGCDDSVGHGDGYIDNIACASTLQFYCGQQIGPGTNPEIQVEDETSLDSTPTVKGTQCLIHADNHGTPSGQDELTVGGSPPTVRILGGSNNPNTALHGIRNLSRSDSIVTALLYDGHSMCNSSSGNGPCSSPDPVKATVLGFIQLGVKETSGGDHQFHAVIMNVVGCRDAIVNAPPGNAISGGASPIPVRLVQAPVIP
jgi:hypothetical protein